MRELSLFTGAGGGLLASRLLGWRTVAAVEYEPYCQRVLCARGGHMADASSVGGCEDESAPTQEERPADAERDDGQLPWRSRGLGGTWTGGEAFPIYPDVRTFDGTAWRGKVDVVSGGFPCQPHSQAGKRLGGKDDRDLWPDTVRILRESGAPLGFFENVPGLLTSRDDAGLPMFGRILGDLSEAGYDAVWTVLGADDVGAPHRRKRLWILAYRPDAGLPQRGPAGDAELRTQAREGLDYRPEQRRGWWAADPADVGDGHLQGLEGHGRPLERAGEQPASETGGDERRPAESRLGGLAHGLADWLGDDRAFARTLDRVATGVPDRVGRLRALGNGQVPLCAAVAFCYLYALAYRTNDDREEP